MSADVTQRGKPDYYRSFVFLVAQITLGLTALALILLSIRAAQRSARVGRLPPLGMSELQAASLGEEVLVEGRISPENITKIESLVAYVLQEWRYRGGSDGKYEWVTVETYTPALSLEIDGGSLQIVNSNYRLEFTRAVELSKGSRRYYGLVLGQPAMAVGRVTQEANGVGLSAEFVASGSKADYLQAEQATVTVIKWGGYGVVGLGLLFLALLLALNRRGFFRWTPLQMSNLSDALPDDGVEVPIRATFTGGAGIPLLALAHNNLFPMFKLFNDHVEFRVITRQRRTYSSIGSVHVFQSFLTNNVIITWRSTPLTFVANVMDEDNLIQVVRFLARKQAPLTPAAQMLIQGR